MATPTPNQVNQVNQNNLINVDTNSDYYLNMMISSQIANQISKFSAKDGFNYKNILVFGMLLSINELKNLSKYVAKESSSYIVNNYQSFFTYFYNIFGNFTNMFSKKQIAYPKIEFIDKPIKLNFKIKVINEFVNGFINFLKDNKNINNVSYNISNNKNITINDMETILISEVWNNIIINYNNINIRLSSELNLSFENNKLKSFNSILINDNDKYNYEFNEALIKKLQNFSGLHTLINDPIVAKILSRINKGGYGQLDFFSELKSIKKFNYNDYESYGKTLLLFNHNLLNENITIHSIIYSIIIYYFPQLELYFDINYIKLLVLLNIIEKTSLGKDIFSNNSTLLISQNYDELYFLDIHLKIPDSIKLFIKKNINKIQVNKFINNKNIDHLTHCIIIKQIRFLNVSQSNNGSQFDNGSQYYNPYISSVGTFDAYIKLDGTHFNNSLIKMHKQILQNNKNLKFNKLKLSSPAFINIDFRIIVDGLDYGCIKINQAYLNIYNNIDTNTEPNTNLSSNTESNPNANNEINFVCEGYTNKISIEQVNDDFNNFINDIKKYEFTVSNKNEVNICKIKLEKVNSKKEISNPEYQSYLEKKELLENMKLEKSEALVKELSNIPQKTIIENIITKEVKTQNINKGFKNLDTMYLRSSDEQKLLSVLSKFKSNKELLKSLGLPNKLCVLLDGLPGTGKSSTILTIASYLKKDIYYLSFGDTIETNEDLQMIFDHVIKNCNGGIIVAEDIDAVGTLLHDRNNINNHDRNNINNHDKNNINNHDNHEIETKKLSLAYILNLLQGTITPDNLIFIATTNHIQKLDPAFYRHGRFDVQITFKLADHYQLNKIYNKFFNKNIPSELLKRIPEDKFTPAQFIFRIKDYISEEYTDEIILSDFLMT